MAIYKITDRFDQGSTIYVKFYVYTPIGGNANDINSAGVPWRTVVAEMRAQQDDQRLFSMPPPPGITVAQLDAGEYHVWSHNVTLNKPVTVQQALTAIEQEIVTVQQQMLAQATFRLEFWGLTGNTG